MTSSDQDQISLDDLFAAVGVSVPSASSPPSQAAATQKDTTEQELLDALGIPHIGAIQKQAVEREAAQPAGLDKQERQDEQRLRARQWRQELERAGERVASVDVSSSAEDGGALTQPLQASVSALPALTESTIRPFGTDAPARIGVLESASGAPQPGGGAPSPAAPVQASSQPRPTPQNGPDAFQAAQPFGQGAAPSAQQRQGVQPSQASAAAQPGMQPPLQQAQQPQPQQVAFQQAQQMPLRPLQPVDQAAAQVPQQAAGAVVQQPFQSATEAIQLRSIDQRTDADANEHAQMPSHGQQAPFAQSAAPTAEQPPLQQPRSFQNVPVAAWQQQMAQQVGSVHAEAQQEAVQAPLPDQAPPIQTAAVEELDITQMEEAPASPLDVPVMPVHPMLATPSVQPGSQPASFGEDAPEPSVPVPSGLPVPAAPQQPQGMPVQPLPAPSVQPPTGEALEDLEREAKTSKLAHVVGGILIFIAVVCVAFAICLLTGVIDLAAINPNHAAQTSSASTSQLSGQAAPSATSSDASSSSSQEPALSTQSGSKAGQVVYSYVVRGVDGGTHEAVETATFGDDGKLISSSLEIQTESQMDSEKLLDQLKQEFGESLTEGTATEDHVVCTVQLPRDDLDRDAYTELLSTNAPEFKIVSS